MLAPGDFLLKPTPEEPNPQPAAGILQPTTPPAPPVAGAEDDEPRSFLLTLLRALGAIHT